MRAVKIILIALLVGFFGYVFFKPSIDAALVKLSIKPGMSLDEIMARHGRHFFEIHSSRAGTRGSLFLIVGDNETEYASRAELMEAVKSEMKKGSDDWQMRLVFLGVTGRGSMDITFGPDARVKAVGQPDVSGR